MKKLQDKRIWAKKELYILIPILALVLTLVNQIIFFFVNCWQMSKLTDTRYGIENLLEIVQKYLNYTEHNAIATILGLFATVVSVWVSLSIYNIVEKKDVQKTKDELQKIYEQMESLKNNYSTFNISSLKYIKVWEDRVNGYYASEIWGILKRNDYPAYEIATSMVRIENLLNCVVERFNNNSYYTMKEFLTTYQTEVETLQSQIKELRQKYHQLTEEDDKILKSYVACRTAEYFYYLYFREKYLKKPTAALQLEQACNYFKKAYTLCPEADIKSNGYMSNALAHLYYHKHLVFKNSGDKKQAIQCIRLAYNYSKIAVQFDSHYDRNYRNYGVHIECYAKLTGINYKESLIEAKKQYIKALNCNMNSYKNIITFVSCVLKILDIEIGIAERTEEISNGIFDIPHWITHESLEELNLCYNYLILAILQQPNDAQAHYHMIHILMYMYLFSNDDWNLITISREDIVLKAKTEIGNCEAIFTIDKSQVNTIMAFLFKARNFYETIQDINNAMRYNEKILAIKPNSKDANAMRNFYKKILQTFC